MRNLTPEEQARHTALRAKAAAEGLQQEDVKEAVGILRQHRRSAAEAAAAKKRNVGKRKKKVEAEDAS